jgi:hypothetical protein
VLLSLTHAEIFFTTAMAPPETTGRFPSKCDKARETEEAFN